VFGTASNSTFSGGGVVIVESGGKAVRATIEGGGQLDQLSGGTATNTTVDGGTWIVSQGAVVSGTIGFVGNGGTVVIDGNVPTNTITGFAPGDTIDLTSVMFTSGGSVPLTATNLVKFVENGATYTLQFNRSQDFLGQEFELTPDSGSGTDVTLPALTGSAAIEARRSVYYEVVASGG
jgi:autotransporter passenger strand-loop-strand repeat protein